ncbi:hypothetical protein NL676_039774 [Syzygium grande]|nr:hypothetical protein NL676_039774 [Syzygium grande]
MAATGAGKELKIHQHRWELTWLEQMQGAVAGVCRDSSGRLVSASQSEVQPMVETIAYFFSTRTDAPLQLESESPEPVCSFKVTELARIHRVSDRVVDWVV